MCGKYSEVGGGILKKRAENKENSCVRVFNAKLKKKKKQLLCDC